MAGTIVIGMCIGIMVVMVNENYRRNLKKEIYEVKAEILESRLDSKRDYKWLIERIENVYRKDKEIMEALKRVVERSNEEE